MFISLFSVLFLFLFCRLYIWTCVIYFIAASPVLTQQEKLVMANREKDKGNEAFRANDYEEAISYYSRSLEFLFQISNLNTCSLF